MAIIRHLAGLAAAVSLTALLLSVSILIPSFSERFYEREFEKNGSYALIKTEREDLMPVVRRMLRYLGGREASLNTEAVVDGEARLFFSEIEITHMEDVKGLFALCLRVRTVSAITLAASLMTFLIPFGRDDRLRRNMVLFLKYIFFGSVAAAALTAVLAISTAAGFDRAFVLFHEVFFDNDLWLLDPRTDLLINILPIEFFIDAAIYVGALFLGFTGLAAAVSGAALRKLGRGGA